MDSKIINTELLCSAVVFRGAMIHAKARSTFVKVAEILKCPNAAFWLLSRNVIIFHITLTIQYGREGNALQSRRHHPR
jgi:hypothetical protein